MNAYLLNRALGSISPSTFHVAQTTQLVQQLEPAPGIRFSARRDISVGNSQAGNGHSPQNAGVVFDDEVYAHKAGVNVLAIDHYDGRLYVTPILYLAPINGRQYGVWGRRPFDSFVGLGDTRLRTETRTSVCCICQQSLA